jgi:hypothetical protein
MDNQALLVLIAPPGIEEALVDFLLAQEHFSGFSAQKIEGSPAHGRLTLAEQVTGRKRQVMFHVHAPREEVDGLLERLRRDFRGAGLHYWVMPVIEAGPIP